MASERFYRAKAKTEHSTQLVIAESDLWITSNKPINLEFFSKKLRDLRSEIEIYGTLFPDFFTNLSTFNPEMATHSNLIIKMIEATAIFNIGPMAAVAGGIAQELVAEFDNDYLDLLIENGGDVYMHSQKKRIVGILMNPKEKIRLGMVLQAKEFPCALCASSAKIGHSLSFGQADLVMIRSESGFIADAAATFFANKLKSHKDIPSVLDLAKEYEERGVQGIFAQCHGKIGIWGNIELTGI